MKVIFGGDVVPAEPDLDLFSSGDPGRLLNGYYNLWSTADFRVLNLECPLTESEERAVKVGPHLKAPPECIAFFSAAAASALCLANNHIRDYGDRGVLDTLSACREAGVPSLGAGATLENARRPLVTTVGKTRLAVVAMAECEFNLATDDRAGANPIDYPNLTLVRQLHEAGQAVLAVLHGGTERLPFPRPGLVALCRFLVEQGTAAVIVQHTHCPGCAEIYHNAPIVYGQGNCIFRSRARRPELDDPQWFSGMLVELEISDQGRCTAEFHPYEQSRGFAGLRPLVGRQREQFLHALAERSRMLEDPARLRQAWLDYCRSQRLDLLSRSHGLVGVLASLDHRTRLARWVDRFGDPNLRWNLVACESHRELLADCLRLSG